MEMVSEKATSNIATVPVYIASFPYQSFSSPSLAGKGLGDGLIYLPPSPLPARKGERIGRVMKMVSEKATSNIATVPVYIASFPYQSFSSPSLAGKGLGDRS
jgi:hypothetical protein